MPTTRLCIHGTRPFSWDSKRATMVRSTITGCMHLALGDMGGFMADTVPLVVAGDLVDRDQAADIVNGMRADQSGNPREVG